jgi:ataxin 1/1L
MTSFGLKCQRLQVGDVCISLKPREIKVEPPLSPMAQKRTMQQREHHQREIQREMYHQQQVKEQQHQHQQQQQQQQQQDSMPQNLSRRSSAIPTTATDTSISSQMAQYSPALYSLQMSLFAAAAAGQGRLPASYAPFMNEDSQNGAHLSHDLNTSLNNNNSNDKLPRQCSSAQDDYDESRKRRWSAPDIDEEQQQLQQQSRKIVN